MITDEQADQIKEQLLQQLKHFPEDKREQMKQQVLSMSTQEVEEFVKQNQLAQQGQQGKQQCVFCSIIEGKIPCFKINENKGNIAILELNPLSKGHTLIIPREHLDKTPDSSQELAKQIADNLKEKLKPKEVNINETNIMGHALLEVIPIYGDEKERKKVSEQELKELQKIMMQESKEKKIEEEKPKKPEPPVKLKPRIP